MANVFSAGSACSDINMFEVLLLVWPLFKQEAPTDIKLIILEALKGSGIHH